MSRNGNRPGAGAAKSVGESSTTATETSPHTASTQAEPLLAAHAAEIRRLGKRVVSDVIEIGARLTECKRICGHGNWLPWLEREFGWTDKTAERFMSVHALVGKFDKLSNLELPISGLYLLAAPSTPDDARDAVLELGADGERLRLDEVRAIIAAHSPEAVFQAARELGPHDRGGICTGVAMSPYAERGLDLYETPAPVVRALLEAETFDGEIWECANGRGAISRLLRAAGYRVVATDIEDYGCANARSGLDFLSQTAAPKGVTTILTNPPYMHADEFVRHALTLAPRVVMLLRLAFLEGVGRADVLDGGQLARVHVFRNRLPMMHRDGWAGPHASSAIAMGWFIWERGHRGPAELRRISWEGDEAPAPAEAAAAVPAVLGRAAP